MTKMIAHTGGRGQPPKATLSRRSGPSPAPFMLTAVPPPPTYFDQEAQGIWQEIATLLIERENLAVGDLAMLEMFAHNLSLFRACSRTLSIEGYVTTSSTGRPAAHPLAAVRKGAELQLVPIAVQLGLSPKARKDISQSAAPGHTDKIGGF